MRQASLVVLYQKPPGKDTRMDTPDDLLAWCPPLDIALYTLSFEYLLSGVQYDVFGKYSDDPRIAYFKDAKVEEAVIDFSVSIGKY